MIAALKEMTPPGEGGVGVVAVQARDAEIITSSGWKEQLLVERLGLPGGLARIVAPMVWRACDD